MVSHTYGHGELIDCNTLTGYTKADDGNMSTFTIDNGDYWKLDVTNVGGNEESKVTNDTNISVSTTTWTTLYWRYKCSNSDIKAKIIAEFSDAVEQTVLADSNSEVWTVGSATLTSGKTLDHIQVYADHFIGEVYYDFLLQCKGAFTLPNIAYGMKIDFPPKEAILPIPGRDTDIIQHLGTENAVVRCGCDLDQGTWTVTGDTIAGERFIELVHGRSTEPWQWLDTGELQFKVSIHPTFSWRDNGDGSTSRVLDLVMREFSLGDKSVESYIERYGINL